MIVGLVFGAECGVLPHGGHQDMELLLALDFIKVLDGAAEFVTHSGLGSNG